MKIAVLENNADISKVIGKIVNVYINGKIETKGVLMQINGAYVVACRCSEGTRTRAAHLFIDENSIDNITNYEFSDTAQIDLKENPAKRMYGSRAGRKISKRLVKYGL